MISKSNDPAILFDLDGTLVDTAYRHVTSWAAALRDAGILVPEWKIHRRIGMSGSSLVRQLVRETQTTVFQDRYRAARENARFCLQ